MSKYISKFFLTLLASVILLFILIFVFDGGESYAETWILTFGTIIIVLLSFVIALMYYLIDLIKKKP